MQESSDQVACHSRRGHAVCIFPRHDGTPEDIAACAAYLASDAAGFITGQVITVDGGMTRKMIYAP